MASIRHRLKSDGSYTYTVLWREPSSTKQESYPTPDLQVAQLVKRLLDANGQTWAVAENALDQSLDDGIKFVDAIRKHHELLTLASGDTRRKYAGYLANHIAPFFGGRSLATVGYEDIVKWIHWMESRKKSAKTISNVHGFISAAMQTAIRLKLIDASPCAGVSLPRSSAAEEPMIFLTKAEFQLIESGMDDFYKPFYRFLVASGARLGEATALEAKHFDLESTPATFRVAQAWKQDEHGKYYLGPPKTKRSRRTVSLDVETVAFIRPKIELAQAQGSFVFTLKRGGVIRSGSAYNRSWHPAYLDAVKLGLAKKPRIHDLRHTHASWMLQAGSDIFRLSRRLGHESTSTTTDRYSHIMPESLIDTAGTAGRALDGLAPPPPQK